MITTWEFKGITMVTSKLGKIKTLMQIITISLILLYLIFKCSSMKIEKICMHELKNRIIRLTKRRLDKVDKELTLYDPC